MKARLFAVALLFVPAARAQSDAPALALAERYMAATGGSYELIEEQSYVAARIMGDTPTSHARQIALQQAAIRKSAEKIYCHETRKCSGDSGYDQLAGPSIRE
ncbi:MAG: hypothetical protein WDM86_23065 [Rhizomicrobium sp.]